MGRRSLLSVLVLCWASAAWAEDCYVAPTVQGTGTGTSAANAKAIGTSGEGIETCLSGFTIDATNDTVHLAAGTYSVTSGINLDISGTVTNQFIIETDGASAATSLSDLVTTKRLTYATLVGAREFPTTEVNISTGNNMFVFGANVDYITVRRLNFKNILRGFRAALNGNNAITISDIYVDNVREFISVVGDSSCDLSTDKVYACPAGNSDTWDVDRIYGIGVSKMLIRLEGCSNSTFNDLYGTNQDRHGNIIFDDFGAMFYQDGASVGNAFTDCECHHSSQVSGTSFDNGDCFLSENTVTNTAYLRCFAFDAFDAGFDIKGTGHTITDSGAFRNGHFGIKAWHTLTVTNFISGFSKLGTYTQYSNGYGTNHCIQPVGRITATRLTCINNEGAAYLFDQIGNSLLYGSGTGSAPAEATTITGATSGATSRISYVTVGSTGVSGTITQIFNTTGTFQVGEIVTSPSGFSATITSLPSNLNCGEISTTNSVIALSTGYDDVDPDNVDEGCDVGSGTWTSSGDVKWVAGVSGVDPQYPDPSNVNWNNDTNDFNSVVYTNTKGYYNVLPNDNLSTKMTLGSN